MTESPAIPIRPDTIAAVILGAAVPMMLAGRGWMQGSAAAALVLVLVLAARRRSWPSGLLSDPQSRWMAVVLAAWLPAVMLSFDPIKSAETWGRVALILAGTGLLGAWLRERPDLHAATVKAMVAVTTVAAGWAVATMTIGFVGDAPAAVLTRDVLNSYKAAASAAGCLTPVLLWGATRLRGRWRYAAVSAAILCIGVIALTSSRSAMAGLAAGGILAGAVFAARTRRWWIGAVSTVAVAVIVLKWLLLMGPRSVNSALDTYFPVWLVDQHRQAIWQFVAGKFTESPFVGHGINVVNFLPGAHESVPGYNVEFVPSHPHNWLLELLAETGLLGTLPVVAWLGWMMQRLLRHSAMAPIAPALAGLMGCWWGAALFNTSFWSVWWQLTFLLLLVVAATAPAEPSR